MNSEELLRVYLEGAERARVRAERKKDDGPHWAAVVRLTTPGTEDAATLVEWQGVAWTKGEPVWDRDDPIISGLATYYPTPSMVGIVWDLDLANTRVTAPYGEAFPLEDRMGLELWVPIGEEMDPLKPRFDWDTKAEHWIKARYPHAYVGAWELWAERSRMAVNVVRSGAELYRIEKVDNNG